MANHYSTGNRFYFCDIIDMIEYAFVISLSNKNKYLQINEEKKREKRRRRRRKETRMERFFDS